MKPPGFATSGPSAFAASRAIDPAPSPAELGAACGQEFDGSLLIDEEDANFIEARSRLAERGP